MARSMTGELLSQFSHSGKEDFPERYIKHRRYAYFTFFLYPCIISFVLINCILPIFYA